ncbi:hypothetical protein AURDEDRAFT_157864 [Auricularia subglabra TFB-10046 SS5]|nr:hypothetical protein AURDEDRAFT_157864 [Auricularia subglabra TFB-10046 SS5]
MFAISFKSLALAAIALTLAPQPANACLSITTAGDAGLGDRENFSASDGGNQVCNGHGNGGSGDISCNDGYSLSFSNYNVGPGGTTDVHFCTPSGCQDLTIDLGCTSLNCCGGNIPCTCWQCDGSWNDGNGC